MPKRDKARMRITKTLLPGATGALKLARKFGAKLLCVRHRQDDKGHYRHVTVELVVERVPIRPRSERLVSVNIHPSRTALQARARAGGARWDGKARLWRMPKPLALRLGLRDQIVEPQP